MSSLLSTILSQSSGSEIMKCFNPQDSGKLKRKIFDVVEISKIFAGISEESAVGDSITLSPAVGGPKQVEDPKSQSQPLASQSQPLARQTMATGSLQARRQLSFLGQH